MITQQTRATFHKAQVNSYFRRVFDKKLRRQNRWFELSHDGGQCPYESQATELGKKLQVNFAAPNSAKGERGEGSGFCIFCI